MFSWFIISFLFIITVACDTSNTPDEPGAQGPSSDRCDRECLISVLDSYLDALVANDPSRITVTAALKYTDNGVSAKLGQGLWTTAESIDNQKRLDFADPQLGNVATQVVINESSSGGCGVDSGAVIYQVRLKVAQGAITEIESMTVRRSGAANGFFNVQNMKPEPVFNEPVLPNQRMSRVELKAVVDLYMEYLEGNVKGSEVPFDPNCKRYENGVVTAGGLAAFNAQSWGFNVTRRYLVFDEESGIVWGMFPFAQTNNALVVGEAFKVINGKIMMIQAVMARMPAKAWN